MNTLLRYIAHSPDDPAKIRIVTNGYTATVPRDVFEKHCRISAKKISGDNTPDETEKDLIIGTVGKWISDFAKFRLNLRQKLAELKTSGKTFDAATMNEMLSLHLGKDTLEALPTGKLLQAMSKSDIMTQLEAAAYAPGWDIVANQPESCVMIAIPADDYDIILSNVIYQQRIDAMFNELQNEGVSITSVEDQIFVLSIIRNSLKNEGKAKYNILQEMLAYMEDPDAIPSIMVNSMLFALIFQHLTSAEEYNKICREVDATGIMPHELSTTHKNHHQIAQLVHDIIQGDKPLPAGIGIDMDDFTQKIKEHIQKDRANTIQIMREKLALGGWTITLKDSKGKA